MENNVDETVLSYVHWWRNVEKSHVQLEGTLMVAARKAELNERELELISKLVGEAAAPRRKAPPAIKFLQSLLDTPNCHRVLPKYAQTILGDGSLDLGTNVMNPEDRYTTLIDGITAMIRADSIVEEDEESLLESLRDSNPSFLAERLIDGQPVTSDATSIVIKDKIFVLSGDFRLLKSAVKQLIREVGGRTHPTVIKKADYLVTADAESKNWSTSAGGTKVQKALKYEIPIIRESALFGALKATA